MIAVFLVHPDNKILSTSNVPPQQESWVFEKLYNIFKKKLPTEIIKVILNFLDCTMTEHQALKYADELMHERSKLEGNGIASLHKIFLW